MEIGITTFAETTPDPATGHTISAEQRLADLMEEIELADRIGLDAYGVGEHHRTDFAVSSPAVVLGAAAARTNRIRLGSAVSVLSSDDPVRVFQDFATVDLLSHGRAELMAGRGSFTESFPLFGYSLDDYDELFAEKLDLLLAIRDNQKVTWSGKHRAPIENRGVYPRPVQDPLPVWITVGGSPNSFARAGRLGLPLSVAILGGQPERFAPLVELYRESAAEAGHDPAKLPVSLHTHGFLADTEQQAVEQFFPSYAYVMTKLGQERGWPPMTRGRFEAARSKEMVLAVGTPEQMTEKILHAREVLGIDRYLAHFSVGTMPHEQVMHAIELLGHDVAPAVRRATSTPEPVLVPAG